MLVSRRCCRSSGIRSAVQRRRLCRVDNNAVDLRTEGTRPSYADYVESLNYRQPARREAEVRLQQQVEDPLRPLPVLRLRVLQLGIDDLERARERDADAAGDLRQPGFGFRTIGQVEGRRCGQVIEDRLQVDLLVEF